MASNKELNKAMGLFLKYIIMASNIVLLIGGAGLIILGATTLHFEGKLKEVPDIKAFSSSVYIIVCAGCAICIVSAMGLWGSLLDRKWAIAAYIISMLVLTVFLMVGDGMRFFGKMRLGETLRGVMMTSLKTKYGVIKHDAELDTEIATFTKFWDEVQSKLGCCGVDDKTQPEGYNFWQTSLWYAQVLKNTEGANQSLLYKSKEDPQVSLLPSAYNVISITNVTQTNEFKNKNLITTIAVDVLIDEKPHLFERFTMNLVPKVPESCCLPDLNKTLKNLCITLSETGIQHLYKDGCYSKIMDTLGQTNYFSSIGLLILLVMVISIILAVLYLQEL